MMPPKRLVLATGNLGKASEIASVLSDLPLEIISLAEYPDMPEVEETGSTYVENAAIKARAVADYTNELALADDSGLEVDALDGAPGILSSRFAPSDAERNAKVLDMMKNVPDGKRTARFRCAIAIALPSGEVHTCEDSVEGVIAREPKGKLGFGYDPIFFIPELGKHMAELPPMQKNAISHRGKALRKAKLILAQWL